MIVEHFFRNAAGDLVLYEYADDICPADPEQLRREASETVREPFRPASLEIRVGPRRARFLRTEAGWEAVR